MNINFKQYIHDQLIIGLSPMDGYTDEAYRLVQAKIAKPDVIFTEFVSAEGLTKGGVKLYDTLLYSATERPIVGQLFGKDPDSFYKAAVVLCHLGFDGIDINMGCPAKTVTQHGSGAALIGKPELAVELIKSVKSGVTDWYNQKVSVNDLKLNNKTLEVIKRNLKFSNIPILSSKEGVGVDLNYPTVSVKTRIGIDESIVVSWISLLLKQNLDFITLHGRTLRQGYAGTANWEDIHNAVSLAKGSETLIWGNGDIISRQQGIDYCAKYGVSGVLIGRAALGNPWVFNDAAPGFQEKFNTMIMHANNFNKIFPHRTFDCLRKNFLLYTTGHPNAKKLRSHIIHLKSVEELYGLEDLIVS